MKSTVVKNALTIRPNLLTNYPKKLHEIKTMCANITHEHLSNFRCINYNLIGLNLWSETRVLINLFSGPRGGSRKLIGLVKKYLHPEVQNKRTGVTGVLQTSGLNGAAKVLYKHTRV